MYVIRDAEAAGYGGTGWDIFNTEDAGVDDIINLQTACKGDAETVCAHLNKMLVAELERLHFIQSGLFAAIDSLTD